MDNVLQFQNGTTGDKFKIKQETIWMRTKRDILNADETYSPQSQIIPTDLFFPRTDPPMKNFENEDEWVKFRYITPLEALPGGRLRISSPLGVMSKSSGRMEGCRFTWCWNNNIWSTGHFNSSRVAFKFHGQTVQGYCKNTVLWRNLTRVLSILCKAPPTGIETW